MKLLRSARFPALLLLLAAAAGLIVANSPAGPAVLEFFHHHLAIPGTEIDLSLSHWVSDGLLAFFFFAVSVELQYELTRGELRSARRALQPAIGAAGGVIVPVLIYLAFTAGTGYEHGWPIPTATDIAFALGVLAVFGRGLPPAIRVFLLALAILDDIVGIVLIAVLFATDLDYLALALAFLCVIAFAILSRMLHTRAAGRDRDRPDRARDRHLGARPAVRGARHDRRCAPRPRHGADPGAGHPPCAGALDQRDHPADLRVHRRPGADPRRRGAASRPSSGASCSPCRPASSSASPAPAGSARSCSAAAPTIRNSPLGDLLAVGALGGIGFTVSLLLSDLAFEGTPEIRDEAILGVVSGSLIAAVLAALIVTWRRRHHRIAGTLVDGDRGGARMTDPLREAADTMRAVRDRCVWTQQIDHRALVPYLIEESAELIDAVEEGTREDLREELGDLLWQVLFHAEIASRDGEAPFGIDDVARGLTEKMVRRHPHVFGDAVATTPEEVLVHWNAAKAAEKRARTSVLDGVSERMPSLALAQKLLGKAAQVRRRRARPGRRRPPPEAELGDALLALVATARANGWDAERALRARLRSLEAEIRDAEADLKG